MSTKVGIILALLLALLVMTLCAAAGWSRANAASESGLCYVSDWQADKLTIRWYGSPWYPTKVYAIFTLFEDGSYWNVATTDPGAWYGQEGDSYAWMKYDFRGHRWNLYSLECFADTPIGQYSQTGNGSWYQNFQRYYIGSLVIK